MNFTRRFPSRWIGSPMFVLACATFSWAQGPATRTAESMQEARVASVADAVAASIDETGTEQERQDSERLTPEMLWELGRLSAPSPSPDGTKLMYGLRRYDLAANRGRGEVWVQALDSENAQRLTSVEISASGARWSPDGSRIGYLAAGPTGMQVYAQDLAGGARQQLTDYAGGVADFQWSPNGEAISFTAEVALDPSLQDLHPDLPHANARIVDDLLYRHWNRWYEGRYRHLMVQTLESGAIRDLMEGERVHTPLVPFGGTSQMAWAPDGGELCYTAKKVENEERSTDSDLYVVSIEGGEATCITEGMDGFDMEPLYSPDGRWIAFHSMERAGFEADRHRLMLYERGSGEARELTRGFDQSVGSTCWTPDSSGLYFSSVVQGTEQVYHISLEGEVEQLTRGWHDLNQIRVAPDGRHLYALRGTMLRPPEAVRLSVHSGVLETLTHVNDATFEKLELPRVEEHWSRSEDKSRVHSWVIYPPDFDPNKRYPMLVYCQGGPQAPITQRLSYRWTFHLMAARGYVVLAVGRRGMPGFGQAWNDAISKDWGGAAMQDILTATDDFRARPFIDPERVAAIGASFGGYTVFWLMGHDQEQRFCTMVAHCGMFNLESFYGATEELWFPDWDMGGPYWQDAETQARFERDSPHRYVENWATPILIFHGQKDFRVPVTEGMQAFTAAKLKGLPARFVYFPEEGHWVLGPQNGVLWHRLFFDWLDRWCR